MRRILTLVLSGSLLILAYATFAYAIGPTRYCLGIDEPGFTCQLGMKLYFNPWP